MTDEGAGDENEIQEIRGAPKDVHELSPGRGDEQPHYRRVPSAAHLAHLEEKVCAAKLPPPPRKAWSGRKPSSSKSDATI